MSQYDVPVQSAQLATAKITVTVTPIVNPPTTSPCFVINANTTNGFNIATNRSVVAAANVSKKIHVPLDE